MKARLIRIYRLKKKKKNVYKSKAIQSLITCLKTANCCETTWTSAPRTATFRTWHPWTARDSVFIPHFNKAGWKQSWRCTKTNKGNKTSISSIAVPTWRKKHRFPSVHAGKGHDVQVGQASLVCVRDGQQVLQVADLGVDLISPRFRCAFRGAVHCSWLEPTGVLSVTADVWRGIKRSFRDRLQMFERLFNHRGDCLHLKSWGQKKKRKLHETSMIWEFSRWWGD